MTGEIDKLASAIEHLAGAIRHGAPRNAATDTLLAKAEVELEAFRAAQARERKRNSKGKAKR